jgi:hypothetical protein
MGNSFPRLKAMQTKRLQPMETNILRRQKKSASAL